MRPVPLAEVDSEARFGGKAWHLARALRAGLPVPPGFALSTDGVDRLVAGDAEVFALAASELARIGGATAVRSSAVGEDAAEASFAGQHVTVLNVLTPNAFSDAVARIRESAHGAAATAYRRRLGLTGEPRIGVVVQRFVDAECAGVMFCRDPLSGADERVIEAAWGLGESVVAGLVTPDRYRVTRAGDVLLREAGDKDVAVRPRSGGGTHEVDVDDADVGTLCLDDAKLAELHALASACETHLGGPQDIEWAFAGGVLHLLQSRAITGQRRSR